MPHLTCVLMLGWLICGSCGAAHSLADEKAPPDEAAVARWIRELDHAEYRVRQTATQSLADAGAAVLPALAEAAKTGSLERRLRIVDLLGRIYSLGDEASFEPAELALEDIKQDETGSLSEQAAAVLANHYEIREKLAVAAIQKLGGSALYATRSQMLELGDPDEEQPPEERVLNAVHIGPDWTGGDEGLRHVRRLTRLRNLFWVKKKSPVSEEAVEKLAADMPDLRVQQRGPAYLGIASSPIPNRGCSIDRVQPNSAAAKAGMLARDVITQFDGKPVDGFEALIELLGEKLPGQKVPVTVERNGEPLELTIELTGWPKEVGP
jgi:hypothetical protein